MPVVNMRTAAGEVVALDPAPHFAGDMAVVTVAERTFAMVAALRHPPMSLRMSHRFSCLGKRSHAKRKRVPWSGD